VDGSRTVQKRRKAVLLFLLPLLLFLLFLVLLLLLLLQMLLLLQLMLLLARLILPSSSAAIEVEGLEGRRDGGVAAFLLVHVN